MPGEKSADVLQILTVGDKGTGDKIHVVFNAEQQILFILFAEIDLIQHFVGETHALAVAELSAGEYGTDRVRLREFRYLENEKSVAEENFISDGQFADHRLV